MGDRKRAAVLCVDDVADGAKGLDLIFAALKLCRPGAADRRFVEEIARYFDARCRRSLHVDIQDSDPGSARSRSQQSDWLFRHARITSAFSACRWRWGRVVLIRAGMFGLCCTVPAWGEGKQLRSGAIRELFELSLLGDDVADPHGREPSWRLIGDGGGAAMRFHTGATLVNLGPGGPDRIISSTSTVPRLSGGSAMSPWSMI